MGGEKFGEGHSNPHGTGVGEGPGSAGGPIRARILPESAQFPCNQYVSATDGTVDYLLHDLQPNVINRLGALVQIAVH